MAAGKAERNAVLLGGAVLHCFVNDKRRQHLVNNIFLHSSIRRFKVTTKSCRIKKGTASLKNTPDRYMQLIKCLLKLFNNIMLAFLASFYEDGSQDESGEVIAPPKKQTISLVCSPAPRRQGNVQGEHPQHMAGGRTYS